MGTLATLALGDEVKMLKSTSCFLHTPESSFDVTQGKLRLEPIPHTCKSCHCEPRRGVAIRGGSLGTVLVLAFALFFAVPSFAADKLDKLDSARMTTLNMTDEQIAEVYGIDSTKLASGPTLQELNEENPSYIKREYDHKQQVIVGSVVMFCIALAMVLMNNYNPKR